MVNPTFPTQSGTLRHFPLVLLVLASQNGLLPCVQRDDNYSMKEGFAWSYKTKFVQLKDLTNYSMCAKVMPWLPRHVTAKAWTDMTCQFKF